METAASKILTVILDLTGWGENKDVDSLDKCCQNYLYLCFLCYKIKMNLWKCINTIHRNQHTINHDNIHFIQTFIKQKLI